MVSYSAVSATALVLKGQILSLEGQIQSNVFFLIREFTFSCLKLMFPMFLISQMKESVLLLLSLASMMH